MDCQAMSSRRRLCFHRAVLLQFALVFVGCYALWWPWVVLAQIDATELLLPWLAKISIPVHAMSRAALARATRIFAAFPVLLLVRNMDAFGKMLFHDANPFITNCS